MKLVFCGLLAMMVVILAASCQNEQEIEFNRYYSGGSALYQQYCQNCHGKEGLGLQSLIPPLTDSTYLKNNKTKLACFVQKGLEGKITVNGRVFDDQMQGDDLSPIEIAKVLTYITNSFGNKLGTINLEQVQGDLKNCK
ncbi:c-type cytochrome [Mucilaginibacter celer]|uniref:Cytochrome c n=1 Tax=Mucilaginibacter celer TaxID=2305508 RepID=A0A494VMV4_9SPHI|nr:cytochrome c [Mucilaginibacter celer]AYL95974.1 cytochrome c [Mucilaginibacter celer]